MKTIARILCILALSVPIYAKAIDISQTVALERYTLVDNSTFLYENGYLYLDGTFHTIISYYDSYSLYGLSPSDIEPISGKPVMNETMFNSYHGLGYIPKWIRSRADFQIGYVTYVIVAVIGKGDPNPAITITVQPQSDRLLAGWPAFMYVNAEPWEYLTYQWYYKNKPIPGETNDMIWIDSIGKTNAGLYRVAISSGGTPVFSQYALLQLCQEAYVKKQPKTQTATEGKNVTLRVGAGGTPPFVYQWWFGTNQIAGATNSFYVITNAQPANAGPYVVTIDNGVSWAVSAPAVLTVIP